MACTVQTKNFYLEASNIYFGRENAFCITPAAGLSGGEYFTFSTPTTLYYVWTEVNAVGADPAPAGRTGIKVVVGAAYTVADWITAFVTAAEATTDGLATPSTDGLSVKWENYDIGAPLDAEVDVDTGFTIASLNVGYGGSLGKTKEGMEATWELTLFDVLSNQNGETLEDQIMQGAKVSLSASLLEVTATQLENIIGNGMGDTHTPAAGTKGVGFGTSKNFNSTFQYAGKLILHPVRLADSVRTSDFVIWKTLATPETVNYDGTDTQALSVTFNGIVDDSKDKSINLCMFGDWRQDFR